MDEQNFLDRPIVPDEKNTSDLKQILAGGSNANGADFVSPDSLAKRQNVILVSVGVVVLLSVGLAMWQMGQNLKLPLPSTGKEKAAAAIALTPESTDLSAKSPEELKKTDSDADQINDFEELYVYETSPYLADSDSDGIADFDEIANHTDPTCPEGKNCFNAGAAGQASADGAVAVAQVNVADLRALLVQSGKVTAEQAAAIDDATLLEIYGQAIEQNPELANQLSTGAESANPIAAIENSAASVDDALQALSGFSADEVRKMLLAQGFSEADLKQISDEELIKLYQEALEQAEKGVKE